MANQILARAGVAGNHHAFPSTIKAIAESGLDGAVIYGERCDAHVPVLIHDTLLHDVYVDLGARARVHFRQVAADMDIFREEFQQRVG